MSADLNQTPHRSTIDISSATFVKLLLFLVLGVFLYLIRDIIALVFASLILSFALNPWVDSLQKRKIPRTLGILIIYLGGFIVSILAVILLIPPISGQISDLVVNFPQYYDQVSQVLADIRLWGNNLNLKEQLNSQLAKLEELAGGAATGLLSTVFSLFGSLVSFVLLLVITLYFTIAAPGLKEFTCRLAPVSRQNYLSELIERMQVQLGLWLQGQMLLCFLIFLLTFLGLLIVGVKYALLLGFIAGLLEVVPLAGPLLAAIPGVFFALAQSPGKALLAVIVYLVVQQAEGYLIVPRVMGKTVNLNPVVVIIVVLIGAKLGGIMGALLAVPVAAAGSIVVGDVLEQRNRVKGNV